MSGDAGQSSRGTGWQYTADVRGHYTPANLASTLFLGMAQVPGAVLYPRLGERFGRTGRPRELVTLVETPLRMVSIGFAMAAALRMH